jgi:hypothetical protein
VSEPSVSAPPVGRLATPARAGARSGASLRAAVAAHPAATTGGAVVALATALVAWAGTRPGFDPYGWLVWGHQTLHWNLNTNGAPSWKPLPYLFTVPYALTGSFALWLWMVTAAAASLAGVVCAARIAYRLTAAAPERRWAALAAGAVAGAGVLGIDQYMHYILSAQSDTIIVSCCLGAADAHLSGRPRLAFWLGVLASLGRPEAWPFAGLYALWLFRAQPRARVMVAGGLLLIPLLWFGIPAITADSPFVAGNLALHSGRAIHGNKILGTLHRFRGLHVWPMQLAALAGVLIAWRRRDRVTLVLAAIAAAWVAVEAAFALHGWPAIPRYMFEASGFMVVVAGVAVGRLLADREPLGRLPRVVGPALVGLLVVGLAPYAVARLRAEHKDLYRERGRARQIERLTPLIGRLGGLQHVLYCGLPASEIEFQSVMAWTTGLNVAQVGYFPTFSRHHRHAEIVFRSYGHGWRVQALHVPSARAAACAGMRGHTASS